MVLQRQRFKFARTPCLCRTQRTTDTSESFRKLTASAKRLESLPKEARLEDRIPRTTHCYAPPYSLDLRDADAGSARAEAITKSFEYMAYYGTMRFGESSRRGSSCHTLRDACRLSYGLQPYSTTPNKTPATQTCSVLIPALLYQSKAELCWLRITRAPKGKALA